MFWKVILILAGTMITVGGLCATIRYNSERIDKVEVIASGNKGDIRELKTDIKYIKSGVDDIKDELKK
jgi:hypothetical protein